MLNIKLIDTIICAGINGADYVEMDVLLTSMNISEMTIEEVKKIVIRAGDKEDTVPSLEELAREVKGKTKLLLEFKTHGKEESSIVEMVELRDKYKNYK